MLQQLANSLTPKYDSLKNGTILWLLFAVAFFIRFPFFFRDYIDRDESTFILMGQSWADGHLPYTELWDLKPPVIFLFFAIIIKIFGKSFIAIRMTGTLLVTLTAWFTYKIGNRISTKKVAFWVAMVTVVVQSSFGSLQGVMSEHICIFFFTIALYLVLFKKDWAWIFLAGIFFGLSLFSKLNMAYPIVFLIILLFLEAIKLKRAGEFLSLVMPLALGSLLVLVLTALPYWREHELSLWWQSVFMAPMAYSTARPSAIVKVSFFFLLLSAWIIYSLKKGWLDFKKREVRILAVISLGVGFSFLQTGKFNGHYLILLYPTLLLLLGLFISRITWFQNLNRPIVFVFIFLLVPIEAYLEYANIVENKIQKGTYFNGEGIDVPNYIVSERLNTENILFFEYHIGYWVLGEKPPSRAATHPSNILREAIFPYMRNKRKTGMEELQYLMEEVRPPLVVTRRNRRVFDKKMEEANTYINTYLESHYKKLDSVDAALIHQRLE